MMNKLQIQYGIQGNGMTFMLGASDYKAIKQLFPKAQPAKRIFIEYDMKTDFESNHAHLEKYVFPALLGFPNEAELKVFQLIEFVKTPGFKVTYKIEQNYDPEIQSLSR
jgi:hypothetical protein